MSLSSFHEIRRNHERCARRPEPAHSPALRRLTCAGGLDRGRRGQASRLRPPREQEGRVDHLLRGRMAAFWHRRGVCRHCLSRGTAPANERPTALVNTTYLSLRRGSRRGVRLLALGVTTLVLLTTLSVAADADDITAGSVLQTATKAIAQQAGAHVVFVAHSSSSSTTEKIIADVGATSG